jgi:hypothetical protein
MVRDDHDTTRVDDAARLARARRVYERARIAGACLRAWPVLLFVLLACLIARTLWVGLAFAALAAVACIALEWRGQIWGRACRVGLVAGLFPLLAALGVRAVGHVCLPGGCVSLCAPACSVGGALAGAWLVWGARRARNKGELRARSDASVLLVAGATLALLEGALGCSCASFAGVWGLCLSLGAAVLIGVGSDLLSGARGAPSP